MITFEMVVEIFGVTLRCCDRPKTLLAMTMYDIGYSLYIAVGFKPEKVTHSVTSTLSV